MEVETAELKNALSRSESDAQQHAEQSKVELDALRAELTKVKREKDVTQSKLRDADQQVEVERRRLTATAKELNGKIQTLETHQREGQSKINALENRLVASKSDCVEAQQALQSCRDALRQLEQKNAELSTQTEGLKKDFQAQLDTIAPTYKEQSEKLKKKLTYALSKEKKRADAYKSKALEAHTKVKTLSETLSNEMVV